MSLHMGFVTIQYVDIPDGDAHDFARAMAEDMGSGEWMSGPGDSYLYFERPYLRILLKDFALERSLPFPQEQAIWAWIESLPWADEDTLEVHFNW